MDTGRERLGLLVRAHAREREHRNGSGIHPTTTPGAAGEEPASDKQQSHSGDPRSCNQVAPTDGALRSRGRNRLCHGGCDAATRRGERLELGQQLLHALPPVGRPLLEAFHHQIGQNRRHRSSVPHHGLGRLRYVRGEHCLWCGARERRLPGQQLVGQHTDRIDVSPVIDVRVGDRLFRRHVSRCA